MNLITPEKLTRTPRGRATALSYYWQGSRHHVWIADVPYYGWSVLTDYGVPEEELVITSPGTRDGCISHLNVRELIPRDRTEWVRTVDDWEQVSPELDAWIRTQIKDGTNNYPPAR